MNRNKNKNREITDQEVQLADIGLAMCMSGTEVAKESSGIIILDDDFTSILKGHWNGPSYECS